MADATEGEESWPGLAEAAKALGLAVAFAVLIDSVLIILGFAVASILVKGLSGDGGYIVLVMVFSLAVIWPVVIGALALVFVGRRQAASMPASLFVVGFACGVTAAFDVFLYERVATPGLGFVPFVTSGTMGVDGGLAFLVSATFAILFRAFLPRRRA